MNTKPNNLGITFAMPDRILIVEDDKKTASLIALYLEREGFQTIIAYDGQEALEQAYRNKPGLVVLDLMLPSVDGWEVCRQLRKSSDIPILMLTFAFSGYHWFEGSKDEWDESN
jgi:DNA-binding response OmpR family regulator